MIMVVFKFRINLLISEAHVVMVFATYIILYIEVIESVAINKLAILYRI